MRSGETPPSVSGADIRTFLSADMRGYTRYTQERGDDAASALAAVSQIRGLTAPAFEGQLLELRGDEAHRFTPPTTSPVRHRHACG
jgi:class 3 adenylate cyclase